MKRRLGAFFDVGIIDSGFRVCPPVLVVGIKSTRLAESRSDMDASLNQESDTEREFQQDLGLAEALEPLYRVIIHNDDVTPFDFVIIVLQRFFQLKPLEAEHVTFIAHNSGQALVATLPLTEAQKRVGQAHFAASLEGYPLMFTIEPE